MRVALVFGGRSSEHDVSVVSARTVWSNLDNDRHEVLPMAIDRLGRWADSETSFRVLTESGDRADQVVGFEGVERLDLRLLGNDVDIVIPMLHGPYGEDGAIQGLFEALNLPYVGCDHASSAVCMDKRLTKRLLEQAEIDTTPWIEISSHEWHTSPQLVTDSSLALGFPLFTKPARLGSSVGISKVSCEADFRAAIDTALSFDTEVIVEKGLDAREIEVAVLGNNNPRASVPGEIVPGDDFYSYSDKYLDDRCQLLAPAPVTEAVQAKISELAIRTFRQLGCSGMARVDLFLDHNNDRLWVNEVNTIPGFTAISMYPRLWRLSGVEVPDLLDELIRLAVARHTALTES
jgi:D-alanine-D-alanine ligase